MGFVTLLRHQCNTGGAGHCHPSLSSYECEVQRGVAAYITMNATDSVGSLPTFVLITLCSIFLLTLHLTLSRPRYPLSLVQCNEVQLVDTFPLTNAWLIVELFLA